MNKGEESPPDGDNDNEKCLLPKKAAVSYIRIASSSESDGEKLTRYYNFIEEEAGVLGAEITARFEDVGVSADPKEQTDLQKLMDYLTKNQVDYVIVPNFSMMMRETSVIVKYADRIAKSGAKLVTPAGQENTLDLLRGMDKASELTMGGEPEKWEICTICHEAMKPGVGCSVDCVYCNGRSYERIKAGDEKHSISADTADDATCPSCGVGMGQYHHWSCDVEECPFCGDPLVDCDCEVTVFAALDIRQG